MGTNGRRNVSDLREAVARAIHGATIQASEYGELPWRRAEERREADAAIAVARAIIEREVIEGLKARAKREGVAVCTHDPTTGEFEFAECLTTWLADGPAQTR